MRWRQLHRGKITSPGSVGFANSFLSSARVSPTADALAVGSDLKLLAKKLPVVRELTMMAMPGQTPVRQEICTNRQRYGWAGSSANHTENTFIRVPGNVVPGSGS